MEREQNLTWKPTKIDTDIMLAEPDSNHTFTAEYIGGGQRWTATHTWRSPDYSCVRLGFFDSLSEAQGVCEVIYRSRPN